MRRNNLASASPLSASRAVRGAGTESLWAVNQRLANAERELRVQFTRIAQLQAQLDVVLGALQRSTAECMCDRHPERATALTILVDDARGDFASLNSERNEIVIRKHRTSVDT